MDFYFVVEKLAIQKFKELHKQKTGLEISDQAALEHFTKLITLIRAIYRPIPISDEKELERLSLKNKNGK